LIAKALLEFETISGEEVAKLMRGEKIVRPEDTTPTSEPPPAAQAKPKSSVPLSGSKKPGGFEPEPQPGT
jgi:cell division protease FtsH